MNLNQANSMGGREGSKPHGNTSTCGGWEFGDLKPELVNRPLPSQSLKSGPWRQHSLTRIRINQIQIRETPEEHKECTERVCGPPPSPQRLI